MIETVKEHCQHPDCMYRTSFDYEPCCGYLLITGELRNSDISVCDKYKSGYHVLISTLGGLFYQKRP